VSIGLGSLSALELAKCEPDTPPHASADLDGDEREPARASESLLPAAGGAGGASAALAAEGGYTGGEHVSSMTLLDTETPLERYRGEPAAGVGDDLSKTKLAPSGGYSSSEQAAACAGGAGGYDTTSVPSGTAAAAMGGPLGGTSYAPEVSSRTAPDTGATKAAPEATGDGMPPAEDVSAGGVLCRGAVELALPKAYSADLCMRLFAQRCAQVPLC
jgi:hypothetical protein